MSDPTVGESDGIRVNDIEVAGSEAYLVEPIAGGSGSAILFLHWFDTEAPDGNRTQFLAEATALARDHGFARNDFFIAGMDGLELHGAAGEPNELHPYDTDHGVRDPQAAADRAAFLGPVLGWPDA